MGYHQAGFEVVGVDIAPQPHYPFEFHQADATTFPFDGFDAIHASPPCQGYVQWQGINRARNGGIPEHPLLIEPTRRRLMESGLPYVIENVPGAPIRTSFMLCGSMFGLGVRRHRNFESNVLVMGQPICAHTRAELAIYGKLDGRRVWTRVDGSEVRVPTRLEEGQAAMRIDWMTWDELREAIPPAYTEWIGSQLCTPFVPQMTPNLTCTDTRATP